MYMQTSSNPSLSVVGWVEIAARKGERTEKNAKSTRSPSVALLVDCWCRHSRATGENSVSERSGARRSFPFFLPSLFDTTTHPASLVETQATARPTPNSLINPPRIRLPSSTFPYLPSNPHLSPPNNGSPRLRQRHGRFARALQHYRSVPRADPTASATCTAAGDSRRGGKWGGRCVFCRLSRQ